MISIAEARLVDISGKGECCMNQEKIDRINFLARKSRTDGLTDAEKEEHFGRNTSPRFAGA